MDLIPAPHVPRAALRALLQRRAPLWIATAVLAINVHAAEHTEPSEPVTAVWKEHQVQFSYRSSTAVYTCRALVGRVATIMRGIGARDDVKVKVNPCVDSSVPVDVQMSERGVSRPSDIFANSRLDRNTAPRQFVDVRVTAMVPVKVTDEVLAELEKDKSRRELVSRVTVNPRPRFDDPVQFQAERQPLTLSRRTIGLEPEDCELLDQMVSAGVFQRVGARVSRTTLSCEPGGSRIPPQLVVDALVMPALMASRNPQKKAKDKDDEGMEEVVPGAPEPSEGAVVQPTSGDGTDDKKPTEQEPTEQ